MSKPSARHPQLERRRDKDRGFTLVEVVMAIVLSGMIAGVVVAAIVTALNIADSTNDQLHDSVDAGLVSAFLYRDAQAAGGIDPARAQVDSSVGVSTSDWAGCTQSGSTLVVRFSWYDRQSVTTKNSIVSTYAFNSTKKEVTRHICQGGTTSDQILGRAVKTAGATCTPSCSGLPDYVTIAMSGSSTRQTFDYKLTASLRGENQTQPTTPTTPSRRWSRSVVRGPRPVRTCRSVVLPPSVCAATRSSVPSAMALLPVAAASRSVPPATRRWTRWVSLIRWQCSPRLRVHAWPTRTLEMALHTS